MNINYKYNGLEEARLLTELVEQKLATLDRFINPGAVANCDVEFEKVANQQNGKIYRLEINIAINGSLHRAEATEDSFEKAIDEVRNELDKELRRAKGKSEAIMKRTGRKIKELFFRN